MLQKSIIGVLSTGLAIISFNVSAAIIDNGTYTTDTASGLDWLDLTETNNWSYDRVTAELGIGGSLEGWRYASAAEVSDFFDAFGGDSSYYESGWSTQNNGLFDALAPFWGDTYCDTECTPGSGYSKFYTSDISPISMHYHGLISDLSSTDLSLTHDFVILTYDWKFDSTAHRDIGSALVRSMVPVPAAMWLFGSGLLGLIGVARSGES